ncbi:MAG: hypothetical protein EOP01_02555, partial [Propionibacteriaceae bacterium]
MGLKRALLAFVALLVVVGLVLGAISGIFASVTHRGLEAAGLETPTAPTLSRASPTGASGPTTGTTTGSPSSDPTNDPSEDPSAQVPLPAPVLAGTEGQGHLSAAAVADRVRGVKVKDSGG